MLTLCNQDDVFLQFLERGCENCPFLEMRGDRQAVDDATTGAYSGFEFRGFLKST